MAATGSNPGPCHGTGDRAPGVPSQINTIQTRAALPIHPAQAIRFSRCASRWTEPRESWPAHRPDAIGIDRAKGDRPREAPAPGWEQTPRCRHGPAASIDGLADWPAASQSLAGNARIGCSFPSITGMFSTSWNSGRHRSPGGSRSGGIAGSGLARRNAPPTAPGEPAKARPEPPDLPAGLWTARPAPGSACWATVDRTCVWRDLRCRTSMRSGPCPQGQ